MKETVIYSTEVLICGGLLLLAYNLLLERRVAFRICRIHLLASTAASMIIPLLDIPVWAAETVHVAPTVYTGDIKAEIVEEPHTALDPKNIILAVYVIGTVFSLALTLYQLLKIRRIRRNGSVMSNGRPRIVRAADNISSFSFFGTVYVGRDTRDEDLQAILAHESSHIAHRHSAERMAMELMKAVMWWNPFAWIAQRRLAEVHEYEADADVLSRGYDLNNYIATILKSLLGYSPDIANGLRDSLTKKRFKMMTTPKSGRHALLRTLAVAPVVTGLLCTFSFTAKATDYRTDDGSQTESTVATNQPITLRLSVTDENDAPLGDVKVTMAGKEYTTDANGKLTLSATRNIDVELSRAGYKKMSYRLSLSGSDTDMDLKVKMISEKSDKNNGTIMTMIATSSEKNAMQIESKRKIADETFVLVDKMPTFQGGNLNDFRTYIMSRVRYPAEAINKKISGRVVANFTVDTQGKVTDVRILQTPDRILSEEVIRVLSQSPAWTPGEQDGQLVKVKFTIPVEFDIAGSKANAELAKEATADKTNSIDQISVIGFGTREKDDEVMVDGYSENTKKATVE